MTYKRFFQHPLLLITPQYVYQKLSSYVIGQEEVKRAIAIATYRHYQSIELKKQKSASGRQIESFKKSNILMIGPTGSGKTHIARTLAKILDVPIAIVNATEYTEVGYYGKDVDLMLTELIMAAKGNIEHAERGIIFIDEVDKIARRFYTGSTSEGERDIRGEGVQQALLKFLDGGKFNVPTTLASTYQMQNYVEINTDSILFICAGTFTEIATKISKATIGFESKLNDSDKISYLISIRRDLEKYGMLPEFLGRISVIVRLSELTEQELVRILKDTPDSVVREYQELFKISGANLSFTNGALQEIAKEAKKLKLGARSLRAIFENVLADMLFNLPNLSCKSVKINKHYVGERLKKAL